MAGIHAQQTLHYPQAFSRSLTSTIAILTTRDDLTYYAPSPSFRFVIFFGKNGDTVTPVRHPVQPLVIPVVMISPVALLFLSFALLICMVRSQMEESVFGKSGECTVRPLYSYLNLI